jgi:hypothetical protein
VGGDLVRWHIKPGLFLPYPTTTIMSGGMLPHRSMSMSNTFGLALILACFGMIGCDAPQDRHIRELKIELDAAGLEMQMREDERQDLVSKIAHAPQPGHRDLEGRISLGPNPQWFSRIKELDKEEEQISLRIYKLNAQIKDAEEHRWTF